jgi:hypothetical protein
LALKSGSSFSASSFIAGSGLQHRAKVLVSIKRAESRENEKTRSAHDLGQRLGTKMDVARWAAGRLVVEVEPINAAVADYIASHHRATKAG